MTEQPTHWRVILEVYTDDGTDTGDVIIRDGEVIGSWLCDENDFMSFTPNGSNEPLFTNAMLGPFTANIIEWFEKQNAS